MSDLRWCDGGEHQYGAGDPNALRVTISTQRGNDPNTYESRTQDLCGSCAVKAGFVKDDSKMKAIAGVFSPTKPLGPEAKLARLTPNAKGKVSVDAATYSDYMDWLEKTELG